MIVYHFYTPRDGCGTSAYNSQDRETPLPLYIGITVHSFTRSCELIDVLYKQGLCVSCTRVLQLATKLPNDNIAFYESEGVVCPGSFHIWNDR